LSLRAVTTYLDNLEYLDATKPTWTWKPVMSIIG